MDCPSHPPRASTLSAFTDGVAERVEEEAAALKTPLSDRQLAALAWPGAKLWETLSPTECDAAINEQLQQSR
jgi:hypothetical protein